MFLVVADAVKHPRHNEFVEDADEDNHGVAQEYADILFTEGDSLVLL